MTTTPSIPKYLSGSYDEELRVLVAEARRWKIMPVLENQKQYGWPDGKKDDSDIPRLLPKFSTSRDACEELLADLTKEEERGPFMLHLCRIIGHEHYDTNKEWFDVLRATARQICVAYLIVKGVLK